MGIALAVGGASGCSSNGSHSTESSQNPQSSSSGGGDPSASGDDAGADATDGADGTTITVACGQSKDEWCCMYPGSICWPTWTSATSCSSPDLKVTAMPACGGMNAVRYDVDGGFIYTLYDASTGAFIAQTGEKGGSFGCFGGPPLLSVLASCVTTWDAVPGAPCSPDGGAAPISSSSYCDGGTWSP